MSDGGIGSQIGDQIKSEAGKIVSDVASELKNLPKDVLKTAAAEVGVSGGGGSQANDSVGSGDSDVKTQEVMQKKAAHNRRLQEVKAELENFRRRKQAKKQQEVRVEEQEKLAEIEKKESEKKKRQNWLIKMVQRAYGGSGEGAKPVG
jgi:hypothetical protein